MDSLVLDAILYGPLFFGPLFFHVCFLADPFRPSHNQNPNTFWTCCWSRVGSIVVGQVPCLKGAQLLLLIRIESRMPILAADLTCKVKLPPVGASTLHRTMNPLSHRPPSARLVSLASRPIATILPTERGAGCFRFEPVHGGAMTSVRNRS